MIKTIHLFPELNSSLLKVISEMKAEDWNVKTQFPRWTVKDIFAHLLDTSIRRLSSERDHFESIINHSINTYQELIDHITKLADQWAYSFSNVSPKILAEMIEKYQNELYEYLSTLDPFGKARFPVSWAGEESSRNWFDIAREYTERWHHQMQIREALGKEPLYQKELYYPVLDTFMQALPYHYKNIEKEDGYTLGIEIVGESGGIWFLEWNKEERLLKYEVKKKPNTIVKIDQEVAWKIFTQWNNLNLGNKVIISGDKEVGEHVLSMTCIIIN
ncbi:MAG: hypothetical protein ACYC3W_12200 [Candidatus Nanopelagicales bacterium]